MQFIKPRLTIAEAKQLDLVAYLSSLGYEPARIRNNDYWYLSPLRQEKTPSFKVNRKQNRWFDHGVGSGGNLVDFAIQYHHCTIGELLQKLRSGLSFQKPLSHDPQTLQKEKEKLRVLDHFALRSCSLLRYLKQRRISIDIAEQYCCELRYELAEKTYYGIGFKNDAGGYEIRNPYFKGSSSPKDITSYNNGSNEVLVFEGFMDFLTFKTIHKSGVENKANIVVLNSLSFLEKARSFMEQHTSIRLYLDRDAGGQNCSRQALSWNGRYSDESTLYQHYKDLNDWAMHMGVEQKQACHAKMQRRSGI